MATVQVRYIVHDVDAAIAFYCQHLGFHEEMHPAPAFAMLSRGDLRLVLSAPNPVGGGGQSMPDGTRPEPGGWNRFSIEVPNLATTVEALRKAGVHFRNEVVTGIGGKQIIVDDPQVTSSNCSSRSYLRLEQFELMNSLMGFSAPPMTLQQLNEP